MVDLQVLSKMDVFPTNWMWPEEGLRFKAKVFNILQKRASKDVPLVISEQKEDDRLEKLLLGGAIHTFTYNNVHVWDSNLDAMNQVLPNCDPEAVYIMSELLRFGAIDADGAVCSDLEEVADIIMEEIPDYDYEFGDVYIDREDIICAAKSFALLSEHDYEGALANDVVSGFADGVSELFDDNITPEQVLQNYGIFSDMFNMSENYNCKIHLYTSQETYAYRSYRERVPENIRRTIDELLDVISCPLSVDTNSLITYNIFSDDERKTTSYLLEILEQDADFEEPFDEKDFNGLWKTAFLTLDKELPLLREKYGQQA